MDVGNEGDWGELVGVEIVRLPWLALVDKDVMVMRVLFVMCIEVCPP